MPSFIHSAAWLALALGQTAYAHTSLSLFNGDKSCIRRHSGGSSPITDLTSEIMACGKPSGPVLLVASCAAARASHRKRLSPHPVHVG